MLDCLAHEQSGKRVEDWAPYSITEPSLENGVLERKFNKMKS